MKCAWLKHFTRRTNLSQVVFAALVCSSYCQWTIAKEIPKTSVADLRYGVALYHYYQQDYLPSLSELMVADARDGIHGHGDNPLLIEGGVNLAFGMQAHAEQRFHQVLDDGSRPQAVRDAAWFYLGKLQYARSDWAAAEQSFNQVSSNFNPDLLAELHALQINLLIKKNQFSNISLKQVKHQELGDWSAYVLYNLGAAHARTGDMNVAQDFLHALEDLPVDHNKNKRTEYFILLDKTYTASGYSFLQEKNYVKARDEFYKVRLSGVESNQALLGYGWAAMAQGKYIDAITPWQLLQKRSLMNPAAQEALLALPFAYEKLNAMGDALREYEHAEELLSAEITRVHDMRANLNRDQVLDLLRSKPVSNSEFKANADTAEPSTLAARVVSDGQNWLKINDTSIVKTRSIYLRELFSRNEFQAQALDLRDLLKLQSMLQTWQPKLKSYTELLQQKQLLRQRGDVQLAQQSLDKKITELKAQRDLLQNRLANINANNDYIALADDATRKTYATIERSEITLHQLSAAGQDTVEDSNRLHMLRGLLQWRAAQEFTGGIASNEKSINDIDGELTQILSSQQKIKTVSATGSDLQPMLLRIEQQQQHLQEQLLQVNAAITLRGEQLRQQVDQQLELHEKRLTRYLAQAHLAVARLYDTALRKPTP